MFAATVNIKEQFGRTVKTLRSKRGLSQEELAHRCGIHPTYLSGIERGKRNVALENIYRIAQGLRLSLVDLFRNIK
jgi:transcriptional regulator with XRE-family HTH domain